MDSVDLNALNPPPVVVQAGGREIAVTPIRVRELAAFSAAVHPLVAGIAAGGDVAALLAGHADAVIDAVAVGARLDREFVLDLGLDELYDLAEAVLTVNLDFFARSLLPKLAAGSGKLTQALAGLPSMPASEPPESAA